MNNLPKTSKEYGLYYLIQLHFSVFPLRNEPAAERKRPALAWEAYQHRLPSVQEFESWMAFNPNYNLALALGNISKCIAVDIDGPTAVNWLEDRLPQMGEDLKNVLANTWVTKTGSGGLHILFRISEPTDIGGQKLIWTDGKPHSEIKLKGNGGYVVLPPSDHENGNRYVWNGKFPQAITKQELDEFINIVRLPELTHKTERVLAETSTNLSDSNRRRSLTPEEMQQLLLEVKPCYVPGGRNDILFHLSGAMRKEGIKHESTREFVRLLCENSGYPDEDLCKSIEKVDNSYDENKQYINGKSGLYYTLVGMFGDKEGNERFSRICQIINNNNPDFLSTVVEEEAVSVEVEDSKNATNKIGENIGVVLRNVEPGEVSSSITTASSSHTSNKEKNNNNNDDDETRKETKVRELTERLQALYHFAAMEDTGELFYFNDKVGKYEPAEPMVKGELEELQPGIITDTVRNIIEKLARRHQLKRPEFDADIYIINMANGLYDIRTNTLRPHDWRYLSRKQIPVKFDPGVRSKKFGKFMCEVNYPNQIRTTIEAMAYTFLRDNPFELYYILLGFGSNGKSVLMHVLTRLHGEDNVSNTSLASLLKDRFSRKELEGKNVNIDMEMSRATIDDMSVLKELTGSQPIRVEPKYLDAYTIRLWAKHFFSTNEMPEMKDFTDAHYRREVIISFPNQFVDGVNANPNLKSELTSEEELCGIFNALMIPLRRIALEHKAPYVDAKTIQDRKLKHQLTTDPVKAFKEYCTEPTDYENERDIPKEEMWETYKKFCADYKLPWLKYDPFCKAFKSLGGGVADGRESSGERKRVWKGIRLKMHLFEDPLTV